MACVKIKKCVGECVRCVSMKAEREERQRENFSLIYWYELSIREFCDALMCGICDLVFVRNVNKKLYYLGIKTLCTLNI